MQLNKDYESEINLKDLLFHVLYRWRSILLVALIGAVALFGYQYFSLKSTHDAGKLTKEERQYQLDLQSYREDLESAKNTIASKTALLQGQNKYLTESAYIQLDPNAVWTASSKYVVKVDPSVMEALPQGSPLDPADSILSAYAAPLAGATEEELIEAFGLDKPEYVRELTEVNTSTGDNSITLSVRGADKETVQKGLLLLQQKTEALTEEAQKLDKHTLTKVSEDVSLGTDPDLSTKQTELSKNIEQYKKDLQTARQTLDDLEEKEEPTEPGKHYIKMAVIGAILGAFLLAALYAVLFVLRGRLTDSGTLSEQYNLPVLGEFRKSSSIHGEKGPDKLLAKWELGKNREKEETVYDNIAALIAGNPDAKNILLVSTLSETVIAPVKEALASRLDGRTVDMKTDFLRNSEAIPAAAGADAVILTEEKGVSLNKDIERMAETLMISGSKVIGSIIL